MNIKASKIKPLFDNVLVRPLEEETKTASGIVLPDTAKEKPQIGKVMAVGPGMTDPKGKKIPLVVKKDDEVIYKKWGGTDIKVGNEEWQIMEQKDIIAVIN